MPRLVIAVLPMTFLLNPGFACPLLPALKPRGMRRAVTRGTPRLHRTSGRVVARRSPANQGTARWLDVITRARCRCQEDSQARARCVGDLRAVMKDPARWSSQNYALPR